MISKRDIDRVLAASKIEEVVDEKLTKSGASYKCCCPFHKEKNTRKEGGAQSGGAARRDRKPQLPGHKADEGKG